MIEINLLPKQYLKSSRGLALGKTGKYVIAGVAAVVVALISITFFQISKLHRLETNINRAQQRAATLKRDIALVDALSDVKQKITQRMNAVEKLDRHRSTYVRILEDLARNVPEFVWLANYEEKIPQDEAAGKNRGSTNKPGSKKNEQDTLVVNSGEPRNVQPVEIEGYTFTLNALAAFMIKMMRSDYFDKVELKQINESDNPEEKAYDFVISCNVHFLSDDEYRSLASKDGGQPLARAAKTTHQSLN